MFLPGFSAHEATPALSKLYLSTFNHARGQQPGTYVRDVAKCTRREHHNLPCPTSGSCAALPIELSLATTGSDFWDVPEIGRSAFQRTYELLMLAFCVECMVDACAHRAWLVAVPAWPVRPDPVPFTNHDMVEEVPS